VAWALTERLAARVQDELVAVAPATEAPAAHATEAPAAGSRPVSLWRVAEVSLRTLAPTVHGTWTLAHLLGCLPRLARFLRDTPRRRRQQAATIRDWGAAHPGRMAGPEEIAA
jgi:hypothetical protein